MQVFVTGGTGLVGSAVVAELLTHGHTVLALARSEASTQALTSAGAETVSGTVGDLDVLRDGAARSDGAIHLAFDHSAQTPESLSAAIEEERRALETLGEALGGSDRPLVMASGTPFVPGRLATEADPPATDGPVGGRGRTALAVLDLARQGVRSSVVRLPRTAHHDGRGGFAGILSDVARRSGVAG